MHELSIATETVNLVNEKLTEYPGANVKSVTLSVGVYAGVDPEALKFCFPLASEKTPCEGAQLIIKTEPLQIECQDCHAPPTVTDSLQCPVCGSVRVKVISGRETIISSLELNLPDEDTGKNK